MQEKVSSSLNQMSELSAPDNTPSLDEVRDKIEKRYTTALGSAELAENSVQGRMLEVQQSATEMAGRNRLDQIRASMKGESATQVTGGANGNNSSAQASTSDNKPSSSVQQEIEARVQAEQQKNQA